jgi:CHC2 zinc finger/Toprim domain
LPPSVVIGRYVQLKKAGRELRGLSPFARERTPSFFVNDTKRMWHCFSSDRGGDIFKFLMAFEGVSFPEAVQRCGEMVGILIMPDRSTTAPISTEEMARLAAEREERCRVEAAERRESERKASNMAKAIFSQSIAFGMHDGSPPARFFESRGLIMPADWSPRALRYHPACPFRDDNGELVHHPAMIGLFRDIHDDAVKAVSRRPLTADGRSLRKGASLGPTNNCAIKLTPDEDVKHGLHLAEGITSSVAAAMLNMLPVWACGGTRNMRTFPILAGVETLTLIVDHDENGASQTAANECFVRWRDAGKEVRNIIPETPGEDVADVVARRRKEGAS